MPSGRNAPLSRIEAGQSGIVVEVLGGQGMINRLSALGIRPGKRITKVSSMFMRGPVTVQVGNARIAIGFGMAKRIVVDLG
jgi:ferrous iron transport protein A